MKIGNREIGPGQPVFVVAESGLNHNGDLRTALEMVHVAEAAGADAFKVQCFSADCQAVPGAASWQGEDQHAMFKRYEPTREFIEAIAEECKVVGITFFGTPDCLEHARWLLDAGSPCFKVGSDDLTNTPLIKALAEFGLPLILSTGMGGNADVIEASRVLFAEQRRQQWPEWHAAGCPPHDTQRFQRRESGLDWVFLHCVSSYPTPPNRANIRRGFEMVREPYDSAPTTWGYSDHTDGPVAAPLAVALGACLIEKHLTLDRSLPGPDHAFSADPAIFTEMVRRIREAEVMLGDGSLEPSDEEKALRPVARRSIVAREPMACGQFVTQEGLTYKRPGTGLMPYEQDKLIGKALLRDVAKDEQIRLEDVAC